MNPNPDFDLKAFQSEVFKDFTNVQFAFKSTYLDYENLPENVKASPFSLSGMFLRAGVSGFRALGRRSVSKIKNEPDFERLDAKASEVVEDQKIKKLLCPKLKCEILWNLPVEAANARMVRIVTLELANEKICVEYSLEKSARLFSLIILKIWQKGIDGYCRS